MCCLYVQHVELQELWVVLVQSKMQVWLRHFQLTPKWWKNLHFEQYWLVEFEELEEVVEVDGEGYFLEAGEYEYDEVQRQFEVKDLRLQGQYFS